MNKLPDEIENKKLSTLIKTYAYMEQEKKLQEEEKQKIERFKK